MTSTNANSYYGIYGGTVANNVDPLNLGRILPIVPDVTGIPPATWAMPCVTIAGKQMGTFMVPQVGAGVWIQFVGGDPKKPVWMGSWWGDRAEVPALAQTGVPGNPNIVLQSALQNLLAISDVPGPTGGIMLRSTTGATIIVNDTGIYIQNGKGASLVMVGNTVTVNNGALVVM
jgi:uncharacterized protein involved in type VI secretion and phage assembly